jgi:hypothetical protein
VIENEVEG